MRRRTFLTATASATALGLAGCTQEPGDRSGGTDTATTDDGTGPGGQPEGTDGVTDSPDGETPGEGTSRGGASDQAWGSGGRTNGVTFSFSSQSPEVGADRDEADVTRDDEAGAVVVDGTISGDDTCKRARLGSVEFDEAAGVLSVDVETTDIEECEVSGEALVGIDYEGTFEVDGDLPSEIRVSHEGRTVASAAYASATAAAPPTTDAT
jgi:hypothetical protein